jgi:AcrR family transcriptional regulator
MTPSSPSRIHPTGLSASPADGDDLNARLRIGALYLFETRGFDATTAEDIAQSAGISRRTFFRYFPVREDVLFSDHAAYLLLVEQRLRASSGEPIHVAGIALDPLLDGLVADTDFVRRRALVIRENVALRDREVLWLREYQQLLGDFLAEQDLGARTGIFAQIVAAAILAALSQVIDRWLAAPESEDPRALFAELVDEIAESMGGSGLRGRGPGAAHPERTGVVVINSPLSADEIAHLIEGAR